MHAFGFYWGFSIGWIGEVLHSDVLFSVCAGDSDLRTLLPKDTNKLSTDFAY